MRKRSRRRPRKRLRRRPLTVSAWERTSNRFPTRESRAKWLLQFRTIDFSSLTPGQALDLRQNAMALVSGNLMDFGTRDEAVNSLEGPQLDVLRSLQAELRAGLATAWEGDDWMLPEPTASGITRVGKHFDSVSRSRSFRVAFLAVTHDILRECGPRVMGCPRCGELYFKVGKQKYCSAVCSRKARWERFTLTRPSRNYRREYEQAVQRKLGARVRVGRKKSSPR